MEEESGQDLGKFSLPGSLTATREGQHIGKTLTQDFLTGTPLEVLSASRLVNSDTSNFLTGFTL